MDLMREHGFGYAVPSQVRDEDDLLCDPIAWVRGDVDTQRLQELGLFDDPEKALEYFYDSNIGKHLKDRLIENGQNILDIHLSMVVPEKKDER